MQFVPELGVSAGTFAVLSIGVDRYLSIAAASRYRSMNAAAYLSVSADSLELRQVPSNQMLRRTVLQSPAAARTMPFSWSTSSETSQLLLCSNRLPGSLPPIERSIQGADMLDCARIPRRCAHAVVRVRRSSERDCFRILHANVEPNPFQVYEKKP